MKKTKSRKFIDEFPLKIKRIYIPYIALMLTLALGYSGLVYVIETQFHWYPLDEKIIEIIFPFTFAAIASIVFLRKKVHFLKLHNDNAFTIYQMVIILSVSLVTVQSVLLAKTAFYPIISTFNANQVLNYPNANYITIEKGTVNYASTLKNLEHRVKGKRNEDLELNVYLAAPFKEEDKLWLAISFSKTISNRMDAHGKADAFDELITSSLDSFKNYDLNKVSYYKIIQTGTFKKQLQEAFQNKYANREVKDQVFILPKKESLKVSIDRRLRLLFWITIIGTLLVLIMVMIPPLNYVSIKNYDNGKPLKDDLLKDIIGCLDFRKPNKITTLLLWLNLGYFIVAILMGVHFTSPSSQEILDFGGAPPFSSLHGNYWRIITAMFLHAGIGHLFNNMVILVLLGQEIEQTIGGKKMLIIYITAGITGMVLSMHMYNSINCGASGAIFGLSGMLLALLLYKVYPSKMRLGKWVLLIFTSGISLIFGFFIPQVNNMAHLVGLITGTALGIFFIMHYKDEFTKNAR